MAPVVEDLDIVLFNEDKVLKALNMVMLIFFHAAKDKAWHNAKWQTNPAGQFLKTLKNADANADIYIVIKIKIEMYLLSSRQR